MTSTPPNQRNIRQQAPHPAHPQHNPYAHHAMEGVKRMQSHLGQAGQHMKRGFSYLRPRVLVGLFAPAHTIPEHYRAISKATQGYMRAAGKGNPTEIARKRADLEAALHRLSLAYIALETEFRQAHHKVEEARHSLH